MKVTVNRVYILVCLVVLVLGLGPLVGCDEQRFTGKDLASKVGGEQPVEAEDDRPICMREDSGAVCFVAIGDVGLGNENQYAVADAMEEKCKTDGCHFALHLGDNFYPDGVTSGDDPQFIEKFELPYENIDFPFFVVLGNHDYGANGGGFKFKQGKYQIAYTQNSDKWYLPDRYYDFKKENVHFFGLDSAQAFWNYKKSIKKQSKWVKERLAQVAADWRIGFAHHPYLSNGKHGNAGSYEDKPYIPILNGKNIKKLVERSMCDDFDLYISGHDHSLQVLPGVEECPMLFVVSGAGASHTKVKDRNPAHFSSSELGFAYIVIQGKSLHLEMIGVEGEKLFEMDLKK